MRLLVVEDDDLFGAAVHKGLTRSGYAVDWIRKGGDLAVAMHTHEYHGVLVDLGLPDTCGEALVKYIKTHKPGVPVVVMTARGAITDRVHLLDIGADDYMVKPLDLDELGARLRSVTRRSQPVRKLEVDLHHGALTLRQSQQAATWHGRPVQLTNKEYRLLAFFLRRKGQVLARAQLEAELCSGGDEVSSNAVEVHIHFLRRKFSSSLIHTVRGVGYELGDVNGFNG